MGNTETLWNRKQLPWTAATKLDAHSCLKHHWQASARSGQTAPDVSVNNIIKEIILNLSCWSLGPGGMGNRRFHTESWLWSAQQRAPCSWSWRAAEETSSGAAPAAGYELLQRNNQAENPANTSCPHTCLCLLLFKKVNCTKSDILDFTQCEHQTLRR